MADLVFIVEEPSKEAFLRAFLPTLRLPPAMIVRFRTGRGHSRFAQLVRDVLRSWQTPGARFIVLCDQDGLDCVARKQRLLERAPANRIGSVTVRIVCDELETWYLGDHLALSRALPGFVDIASSSEFRTSPDTIRRPARLIAAKLGRAKLDKVALAREIGPLMDPEANTSHSFNVFVRTLRQIIADAESAAN